MWKLSEVFWYWKLESACMWCTSKAWVLLPWVVKWSSAAHQGPVPTVSNQELLQTSWGGGPSQGDQLLWFALDFPIFSTETHRSYLTPQFWVKLDSWSSYSKHCWFWRKVGRTYLEQVDGSPVLWSSRSLAGPSLWTISHEYLHKHSYINGKVQVAYFHFLKSHHGTPYKIGNIKKEKRPITRIAF